MIPRNPKRFPAMGTDHAATVQSYGGIALHSRVFTMGPYAMSGIATGGDHAVSIHRDFDLVVRALCTMVMGRNAVASVSCRGNGVPIVCSDVDVAGNIRVDAGIPAVKSEQAMCTRTE